MPRIKVTDHSLVRFIERMGGLDVEGIRLALSTGLERAAEAAERLGQTEYSVKADDVIYYIKNDTLVTILDKRMEKYGSRKD